MNVLGDTYIRSGSPNQNAGGDTVVRLQQSGKNRGLLFFDTNAIRQAVTPGSLVTATLELTIDSNGNNWGTTGRTIALHRLKKASAEYSATWSCAIDSSVANSTADCSGATAWNMDSTDPNVQPWLSPAIGTSNITNNQTGVVTFNVTADVAAILDNSWAGYGFLLKKVDETVAGSIDFKSKERGVSPRLILEVQPPAAGSGGGGQMDAGVQRATITATADNHVRQGEPNQNFGSSGTLRIQASGRNRAIFNFNPTEIHAALGTNGLVRASLELTITQTFNNWGPDRALGAHRMRGAWSELGSTWNCGVDSNTGNSSADCSGSDAWYMWRPDLPDEQEAWVNPPESTTLVQSGQTGIVSFDVTQSIACYLAGHTPLNGVMIKKEMENQSGHVEFASRETMNPPVLVLEYNSSSGVPVTYTQCTGLLPDGGVADAGVDAGTCTPSATTDVTCNNVDDDCDGQKDEDYAVTSTSCGQGACAATGEQECVNGAVQDTCTAGSANGTDNDCDGIDQDCDGRTDEAYVSTPSSCGVGACLRNGNSVCVAGAVQSACTPGTPATDDTSCNAIDDNCNGSIDEDYAPVATGCGVGACVRSGSTSCVTGTVQDSCTPGTPAASDATCNGIDDNCNGVADEGYASLVTSCGVGACTRAGATSCVGGTVLDSCAAGAAAANDATCDGIDDDCSGAADEDYVSLATNCGVGACASTGTTSCVAGAVQDSCAAGTAAANDTTCDGIDDDCSGTADEDYVPQATHCGVGACAGTGTTSCSAGSVHDSCATGVPEADDSCDLVDQDCDGKIDEGCESDCSDTLDNDDDGHTDCADGDCHDAAECTIGRTCTADSECSAMSVTGTPGKCLSLFPGGYCTRDCVPEAEPSTCPVGSFCSAATGTCVLHCDAHDACSDQRLECSDLESLGDTDLLCRPTCETGTCHSGMYCNPSDNLCLACTTSDTSCDRIDQDCDGTADDDVPHQPSSCGTGACTRNGTRTCVNGQMQDNCVPGTPAASDATCDGIDDDCDGRIDENYAPTETNCGVGACARTGQRTCSGGTVHDSCTAGTPAANDATCNGIDEDCNGTADEDYAQLVTHCGQGACARDGHTSCVGGAVQDSCTAGTPSASDANCNGIDDNCNGAVDEAYVSLATSCGLGVCAANGHTHCVAGAVQDDCAPGTGSAHDTICNGLDDDCDGTVDDEYVPTPTACGLGVCTRTGQLVCVAGSQQDTCIVGSPTGDDSACNNVDEDCDGHVDEAYAGQPTTCGTGACVRNGSTACDNGAVQSTCVAGAPAANDPTCDGADDDCDGHSDENYAASCVGDSTTSCVSGHVVLTSCADANVCNGNETCLGGACQPGVGPSIDDGNPCTVDACTPLGGVTHNAAPAGTRCGPSNANVCNGATCVVPQSCLEWLQRAPGSADGVYTIDVDGSGPTAPFSVYCDMTTAGGGWQLVTVAQVGRNLIGTGYCQSPSASCAGQLHPLQANSRSQILVRDLVNGTWLRYGGFSASASSSLRWFTKEHAFGTSDDCNAAGNTCGNTSLDPSLHVLDTSGFPLGHSMPLWQWWRYGGWWVGSQPSADQNDGRIHASAYSTTLDIRSRTALTANATAVSTGIQGIFHRADGCTNGVRDGLETDIDCGGPTCGGCVSTTAQCSTHSDCASGFCLAGVCAAPERSCAAIHATVPTNPSRAYLLDVDGTGPQAQFQVYCDMTTDGGGWQLISTVRNDLLEGNSVNLVGSSYCTDPSITLNCKGQLNPLQVGTDTELMAQVPSTGDYLVYKNFSASASSALRYFTHERVLSGAFDCGAGNNTCGNSGMDPNLAVARTSGFPMNYNPPIWQWWRGGGWYVANSSDGSDGSLISKTSYWGYTEMRKRTSPTVASTLQSAGHQLLLYRAGTPVVTGCTWRGQQVPAGTACSDGSVCTANDACNAAGVCQGTPIAIDDGDPCTIDSCDPVRGAVHGPAPVGASCSDGNMCNGAEQCGLSCPPPSTGLTHYWPGSGSGSDLAGGATATLSGGAGYTSAAIGTGFSFSGTAGERVSAPDAVDLRLESQTNATYTGFFKTTSGPTNFIVGKHVCNTNTGWFFETSQGCFIGANIGAFGVGSLNLTDGQVHHFACVKNGTQYGEYVDGVLVQSSTGPAVGIANTATVQIGGLTSSSCTNYGQVNGFVDDIALYNRALSASEISALAAQRSNVQCKNDATCLAATSLPYDDGNPCTADACTEAGGVTHVPLTGAACNDGNVCTVSDSCDSSGVCRGGSALDVSDGDPCTTDTCNPASGAVHTAVAEGTSCSDGNECNGVELCRTTTSVQTPIQVNPRSSFLNYSVSQPRILRLSDYGFYPGDQLLLRATGSYTGYTGYNSPMNDVLALFSSSATLLPAGTLNRVPGAIQSNAPAFTSSDSQFNIAQDFRVTSVPLSVTIPAGAAYLFIGANDVAGVSSDFTENIDPDGDYGIVLSLDQPPVFACQAGTALPVDDGNACTADSCVPGSGVIHSPYPEGAKTCAQLGAQCGAQSDGCGNTIDCGSCPTGQVCGSLNAGQCGPTPLAAPAVIHVGRRVNVALYENGGRMIEPANVSGINNTTACCGGIYAAQTPDPKTYTVALMGTAPHVVDSLSFAWENFLGGAIDHAEVWVTDQTPFDATKLVRVADTDIELSGIRHVSFAPVRARFVRIVVSRRYSSGNASGPIYYLSVFTRDREGGVVSATENGANVVSVTSEQRGAPASDAFDISSNTLWLSANAAPQNLILQLVPQAYAVNELEWMFVGDNSYGINNFGIDFSNTTTDPASFTTAFTGVSGSTNSTTYTFDFAGVAAKYARLRLLSNYGAPVFQLNTVRLWSPEFGGVRVPFDDLTDIPASSVASRTWDFGDGTTTSEANPWHTYPGPGTYQITLIVTDTQGRVGVAHAKYTVIAGPSADFDWSPIPVQERENGGPYTTFTDRSVPQLGQQILQRTWTVPSGGILVSCGNGCGESNSNTLTILGTTQPIRWPQDGSYPVQLTVLDTQFLTSTITKTVTVDNVPPTANGGPDKSTIWGVPVGLGLGVSTVNDQGPTDRNSLFCIWDFGDGQPTQSFACNPSTNAQVTHTYQNPGIYQATYTAQDNRTSTSDPVVVTVDRRPTALVPLSAEPTAVDGDFDISAQLYDSLNNQTPLAGFPIQFIHGSGSVTALTGADGIAHAIIHFDQYSYSSVQFSFAGDTRYQPSSDQIDYIVREGDTQPIEAEATQPSAAEGYRFVVAFPQNANYMSYSSKRLLLMLTARTPTTARVRAPGASFDTTVAISPSQVTFVTVPESLRMGLGTSGEPEIGESGRIENKGIEVTSLDEIGIQAFDQIAHSSDGYLALPVDRLGTDYIALGIYNEKERFYDAPVGSQIGVVASEDGTAVTILPTADIAAGPQLPLGARRGEAFTVTLNALQTLQVMAASKTPEEFEDLTGSRITSNKPIAAYAGHVCTPLSSAGSACDHIIEQMPPVSTFGTHFVTVPFNGESNIGFTDGDIVRVMAAYDGTQVRLDGTLVKTLARGEVYQLRESFYGYHDILTSHPALVAQYVRGGDTYDGLGDPAFTLVPPVDQYIDRFVLAPPSGMNADPQNLNGYVFHSHFSVVAKSSEVGTIRMDGQPITAGWRAIGDGTYAGARFIAALGSHVFTSATAGVKFMVYTYGYAGLDSYAMPGGMQLAIPQCRPTKTVAGDGIDNDCDGVEGEELPNGVDDDGDGVPDEDLALVVPPNAPNHAPVVYNTTFPQYRNSVSFAIPGYDADGNALTYRLVNPPAGTTLTDNRINFTGNLPSPNTVFTVIANDGHADSAAATITASAWADGNNCNEPGQGSYVCNETPYFWGGNFDSQVIKVPTTSVLQWGARVAAHDWDRQTLTYSLTGAPAGMSIDAQTGLVSWLLDSTKTGTYNITAKVTDTLGAFTTKAVQLTVAADSTNVPPVFDSTPVTSAQTGQAYSYTVLAHDPEHATVTYQLVTGPSGMSLTSTVLTWTPTANDVGDHSVLVRISDPSGGATVQRFTVSVAGSPLRFVSQPALIASVGTEYIYLPQVVRGVGTPVQLAYDFDNKTCTPSGCSYAGSVAGEKLNTDTGEIRWTPTADQLGSHELILDVYDEDGNVGKQYWNVEVVETNVVPRITTTPVTEAVALGTYHYDVDAADLGTREVLTYHLINNPPTGMVIDMVTGVITWQPQATGSYPVTVQVQDSSNNTDTQTFAIEVAPDTDGPTIDFNVDHEAVTPGGSSVLTVLADDEVHVTSLVVTIDGQPVTLDANGQYTFTSSTPGVHTVVVTAIDSSNNVSTQTAVIGVQDAADTTAPSVSISSPLEDAELTYIHDVVGSVSDANLLGYSLELRRRGDAEYGLIAEGYAAVANAVLGQVDTTLLADGYYELRLSARDVNARTSETVVPFRVGGQAKVGVVQLSFVDAVVPMAGVPISVVRSYDSRNKAKGDFGYGWRLSVKQGSIAHNRPVGEGFFIYTEQEDFALPCQESFEQKSHYTEVRLSEREHYLFRPVFIPIADGAGAIAGSCTGNIGFELVEGSTAGAQLFVLNDETLVRSPSITTHTPSAVVQQQDLVYATDPDRGVFNPQEFQLELRDGRKFDLRVGDGMFGITDRNGNSISITSTGVHHSGGKSVFFERDDQGRISSVIDPMGHEVQYGYDLNGDLVRVTNAIDETVRFTYDRKIAHHLQKVIDAAGREVAAMSYDGSGRLKQTCDAEHKCGQSSYDLAARSMSQTDATARAVRYEYDLRGKVITQTDALNHSVRFQYDADDNLIRAEGPDGSVATYTYDGSKNMLSRVLPHEANENAADFRYSYTYTARNDRETVTLPSGGVIRFDYDADGNQIATKDGDGSVIASATYNADGTVASKTDRFGTVQYQQYVNGQPTRIVDPFGVSAMLAYDDAGRLLSRTERGLTTSYAYDAVGRQTSIDYGNGSTVAFEYVTGAPGWTAIQGPTFGRVEREFTSTGRLGSWTEPNGDTFTKLYDGAGRVSEEIDALGNRTTYGYDAAGRLHTITDVTLNATTLFERDAAGRVTKTTDALGHETTTAYKLGGRLESTTNARGKTTSFDRSPLSASITDALNRTTVTSLSTYGLPGSTTYPGGANTASSYLGTTRLDGSQQFPTSFEDELERSRDYGYDAKSGLTSATDLAGESWNYQYTPAAGSAISYDVFSGSVSTANADGGASAYQSSGGGTEYRDVSTTGGGDGGNFTHLLSQVTSPMGEVTKFERGANGRINKVTYPDNGMRTIAYGADQRPETITLPQGTVVTLDHDAFGREISRTTNTGEFRYLTYGVGDRIEEMEDNTGLTTYSYDPAGRFSGITYPSGASVKYTRDKLDRTTDVKVKPTATAAEIVTHYTYDPNGNLAEITDPNNGVTGFTYDDADRLQQRVLPNGVVTSYGYDSRDRVLSVVHRNASNVVLASVVYERSASGEPTKITREDGTYTKVEYDSALRVKKESEFDANDVLLSETQYGYDLDGNRTSKTTLTGQETYSYAAGFKLTGITGTDGNEVYAHDAGGRLTGIDRGGVPRVMEYDSMDHITRVVDGGIEVERYTFDGMGRRVGVNNGASTKKFLIAPNMGDGYESPQAVTDAGGNVIATFVYAGEHAIAKITPSGVEYFLGDAMGSVVGKASSGGASTASIKYTAFGEVASAVGVSAGIDSAVGAEPRFQGMTLDAGTGLYFVRARTYDARTGRFVSRDPMSGFEHVPETFNAYAFVKSNPFVWQDPTGEFSVVEVMVTSAIAGILAVSEATAAAAAHYLLMTLTAAATAYGIHKAVEASPTLDDLDYAVGRGITAISTILINQTSRGNVKDTGIVEEMQRLAERIREAGSPAPDPCRLLEILEQAAKVSGDRKYLKRIQTTQKAFGCRKHREPGE